MCAMTLPVGVNSATDLAGKKVGVERGTTYQAWAQQNLVDKGVIAAGDLVPYDGINTLTRDLRNGKVDVAVMGLLPANSGQIIFKDLKIAGQVSTSSSSPLPPARARR